MQILFKNKLDGPWGVNKLLEKHSEGKTSIPTELEQIMYEDAIDKLDRLYNNRVGADKLESLLDM